MSEHQKAEITDKDGVRYEVELKPLVEKSKFKLKPSVRNHTDLRKIIAVAFGVLLIIAIITGILFTLTKQRSLKLTDEVLNATSIDVYFPSRLPAGFRYIEKETKANVGYVFMTFEHDDSEVILSEQPRTTSLDEKQLMPMDTFDTPIGKAYKIRNSLQQTQYIIEAPSTLILVSSNETVEDVTIKELISVLALQRL